MLEYNLGKENENVGHRNFLLFSFSAWQYPFWPTFVDLSTPSLIADTGDKWTPQSYDISNIQGFTQSVSIGATNGCQSTTCTSVHCPCTQAYPPGVSALSVSKHQIYFGFFVDRLPPGS